MFYKISIQTKSTRTTQWRIFFHYCDRATIYIFIASSYTPWLYLRSTNGLFGEYMFGIVWIAAFLGIIYQIVFHEKYKLLFYNKSRMLEGLISFDLFGHPFSYHTSKTKHLHLEKMFFSFYLLINRNGSFLVPCYIIRTTVLNHSAKYETEFNFLYI